MKSIFNIEQIQLADLILGRSREARRWTDKLNALNSSSTDIKNQFEDLFIESKNLGIDGNVAALVVCRAAVIRKVPVDEQSILNLAHWVYDYTPEPEDVEVEVITEHRYLNPMPTPPPSNKPETSTGDEKP